MVEDDVHFFMAQDIFDGCGAVGYVEAGLALVCDLGVGLSSTCNHLIYSSLPLL
jgi:hypothetical protein